ncbi:MAG: antibiotic biosynthesis monooxygenase [Hyphomicrobiaceae bacterium]|nr:antibiotic biosynthesis monooxygenase [Hyphomicrobiaceae bacterium]
MLVVTVDFKIKPERAGEFHKAILGHARNALEREPGCLQFDVAVDPENAANVFLFEVYVDDAAFEAHKTSPHMAAYAPTVKDMILERKLATYRMLDGMKPKR